MTSSLDDVARDEQGGQSVRRAFPGGCGHGPAATVGCAVSFRFATLREHLGVDGSIDDHVIAASLREIAGFADPQARLQAAYDSTFGHWLALRRADLASALALVVAAVPAAEA